MTTAHTANTAKKSAKTSKNKVPKYSKRKVDPAFYWMTVPAVILDVSCGLGVNVLKEKKLYSIAIMVIAFLADFVLDVNVIYIIAAGILAAYET